MLDAPVSPCRSIADSSTSPRHSPDQPPKESSDEIKSLACPDELDTSGVQRWISAASFAATIIFSATPSAQAQESAQEILKTMSSYVSAQKVISLTYDSDIEVMTSSCRSCSSPARASCAESS